jgi:hypothetical protein
MTFSSFNIVLNIKIRQDNKLVPFWSNIIGYFFTTTWTQYSYFWHQQLLQDKFPVLKEGFFKLFSFIKTDASDQHGKTCFLKKVAIPNIYFLIDLYGHIESYLKNIKNAFSEEPIILSGNRWSPKIWRCFDFN